MSSFLMGYPHHIQSPMGTTIEPKFPPNEEYHHHHHHNGYASMAAPAVQNTSDYLHHQNNSLHQNSGNFNYAQSIGGHFYHHHHGYGASTGQMPTPQTNSYSPAAPVTTGGGYYGGYYGTTTAATSHHQSMMDLPIQCPNSEPTNTALGLQELGLRLERRIEEAVPAGQQLQELGMRLRCDDTSSEHDDLLDEDRLMLDRSPDEMGSHGNDLDDLGDTDSETGDDANETTTDGERIIYPWMKKIHVAGVVCEREMKKITKQKNLRVMKPPLIPSACWSFPGLLSLVTSSSCLATSELRIASINSDLLSLKKRHTMLRRIQHSATWKIPRAQIHEPRKPYEFQVRVHRRSTSRQ
ncbi:hypothetical protein DMENIID0001_133980 [Sergentomyia squamirostris]